MVYQDKRKKAFLGSIISGVIGIGSQLIGNAIQNKKQREANEAALAEQRKQQAYQDAAAMNAAYNNQGYVDAYKDRITFAGGGRKKETNSVKNSTEQILTVGTKHPQYVNAIEDYSKSVKLPHGYKGLTPQYRPKRDVNGRPIKDASGNYVIDKSQVYGLSGKGSDFEDSDFIRNWLTQRATNPKFDEQLGVYEFGNDKTSNLDKQINNLNSVDIVIPNISPKELGDYERLYNGVYKPTDHSITLSNSIFHPSNRTSAIHELAHSLKATPQQMKIQEIVPGVKSEYLDNPNEIHSRLYELRKELNLEPTKQYTNEEIQEIKSRALSSDIDFKLFNRYDDNQMKQLINDVASINKSTNVDTIAKLGKRHYTDRVRHLKKYSCGGRNRKK